MTNKQIKNIGIPALIIFFVCIGILIAYNVSLGAKKTTESSVFETIVVCLMLGDVFLLAILGALSAANEIDDHE